MAARTRFLFLSLLALGFVLGTASLGVWQISRGKQKEALAAETAATPVVSVHGEWMPEHTVYLDNRTMQGKTGFLVITPLYVAEKQKALIVQRGWVARDFHDRNKVPEVNLPKGLVEVRGKEQALPSKYYALSDALETGKIRQNIDWQAYAKEIQSPLQEHSLQMLDDTNLPANDGLLRQWDQVQLSGAKNYGYAAQWFAMCAIGLGLYLWFAVIKPRRLSKADISVGSESLAKHDSEKGVL